jgi:hypothetical protein
MAARRFLWVIAILIMLVIAAAFAWRLFGERLLVAAMVPSAPYAAPAGAIDYGRIENWQAHPAKPKDAARWAPPGYAPAPRPGVAVFFVTPTAYFDRSRWNAPLDDAATNTRLDAFLRGDASVFNGVGAIWAPRYRQATFGAFLTRKPEAAQALDFAYGDVRAAFTAFLAAIPKDQPIILAGHSQGSRHLLRLLRDVVARDPALKARLVAVYAAGWPVSVEADLPVLGVPACSAAEETGCLLSWQSFGHGADTSQLLTAFEDDASLSGQPRRGTRMLCTNPITGTATMVAQPAGANLGSLVPGKDLASGTLVPHGIPATCLASGVLDIGPAPQGYTDYILPHDNYHVYDYPLFWANLRADVERRVDAWAAAHHRDSLATRPSAGETD